MVTDGVLCLSRQVLLLNSSLLMQILAYKYEEKLVILQSMGIIVMKKS